MKIRIDYGRTGLDIQVPDDNLKAVLGLNPAPPLADADVAIQDALSCPINSPPLAALAAGRKNACILICDITRPVPNEALLEPTLRCLRDAGIPADETLILVATGLHRASTPAEIEEMLGREISSRYRVESHDARDAASHKLVGVTAGSVPALIDRRYVEADLKITTGLIEPHLMAGFSGGRKVICPGIAAVETIRHFHGVAILQSPLATPGQVDGNPVHQLSLQVARLAGCDFIVNVALDEQRRITGIFAGEIMEAWQQGVRHVQQMARAPIAEPVDIVITSAAGYPLDGTFYQAVKGLVGAMPAVRPGGTIIMAAAMQEGIGSAEFAELLQNHQSIEKMMHTIEQPGYFSIDQWQAQELGNACRRASIHVYSDRLSAETISSALVTAALSVESALQSALEQHGSESSIAVIPRGPYVIPSVG